MRYLAAPLVVNSEIRVYIVKNIEDITKNTMTEKSIIDLTRKDLLCRQKSNILEFRNQTFLNFCLEKPVLVVFREYLKVNSSYLNISKSIWIQEACKITSNSSLRVLKQMNN